MSPTPPGGICGSDIHYYQHARVGNFAVKEPLILGHEISGSVAEIGSAVTDLKVGQPVAINPNLPCLQCPWCLDGKTQLCREMVFFGSAAVTPHIPGRLSRGTGRPAPTVCRPA